MQDEGLVGGRQAVDQLAKQRDLLPPFVQIVTDGTWTATFDATRPL